MSKIKLFVPAFFCLLLSLGFSGCVAITAEHPVGEPLSDADYQAYEGSWILETTDDDGNVERGKVEVSVKQGEDGKAILDIILRDDGEGDGEENKIPGVVVTRVDNQKGHFLWVDLEMLNDEKPAPGDQAAKSMWFPIAILKSSQKEGIQTIRFLDTEKVMEMLEPEGIKDPTVNLNAATMTRVMLREDVWGGEEQIYLQKLPK